MDSFLKSNVWKKAWNDSFYVDFLSTQNNSMLCLHTLIWNKSIKTALKDKQ